MSVSCFPVVSSTVESCDEEARVPTVLRALHVDRPGHHPLKEDPASVCVSR